jgi:hypothetical protein
MIEVIRISPAKHTTRTAIIGMFVVVTEMSGLLRMAHITTQRIPVNFI